MTLAHSLGGPGPLNTKTKNRAPKARFCGQNSPKRAGFHAFWSPKQQCNHPITPSTDPTDPARRPHPTGRPAHHLPPLGPTLGTRPGGPLSPAPLPGPRFLFFVFRPVWQGPTTRAAHLTRDQKRSAQPRCSRVWARCSSRRASAPKGLGSLRWGVPRGDLVVCRPVATLALVHLVEC